MVGSSWKKYFPCLRPNVHPAPSRSGGDGNSDADPRCSREGDNVDDGPCCSGGCDNVDALLWHKDLCPHVYGEFSMAVVQANPLLEDHSQVESGPLSMIEPGPQGTFAGIYDGHGGPEVARFINQKLFANVKKFISENEAMSEDVIKDAYLATDEEFISSIKEQWETKPQLASVGSCCLVGVLCGEQLYIANAGDSRVVLGRLDLDGIQHVAVQLSKEHNANLASVREELHQLHHDDSHIVVPKGEVWRVKGIIQVSRAIGDAYLKNAEFNREPLLAKFRLSETFEKPIMTAAPSVLVHKILPIDRFLIFASDGLWEHLTNRQAVDIVTRNDRNGIAKSLIEAAQLAAANKIGISFSELKTVERGERRKVHDDITVIVLYLDWDLIDRSSNTGSCVSVKGGLGASSSDPCTSGKH